MEKLNDIMGQTLTREQADHAIAAINSRVSNTPATRADLDAYAAATKADFRKLDARIAELEHVVGIRRVEIAGNGGGKAHSPRLDKIEKVEAMSRAALELAQKLEVGALDATPATQTYKGHPIGTDEARKAQLEDAASFYEAVIERASGFMKAEAALKLLRVRAEIDALADEVKP